MPVATNTPTAIRIDSNMKNSKFLLLRKSRVTVNISQAYKHTDTISKNKNDVIYKSSITVIIQSFIFKYPFSYSILLGISHALITLSETLMKFQPLLP